MKYLLEIKSLILFFLAIVSVTSSSARNQRFLNGQKPRVVIIGAGVAGIGAASKLLQNGITDVTILEAMDRIGGRIHYVPFGDDEGVDLGAHWIHGQEDNVVYELAEPLGLVNHSGDLANQVLFRPDGSELKLDRGYLEIYEDLFQDVHLLGNSHNFRTLAEVSDFRIEEYGRLISLSKEDIRGLQIHARKNLCTLEGCEDLTDVSLKASDDYEEGEGDELIEWKKGGMANILHLLMGTHKMSPWKGLGVEKTIMLNSRVSRIEWSSMNGAYVVTENRMMRAADFVIFTPSLNVLKKKHTSMFYPSLPQDKVNAIKALGMDVVDKVFLVFNETWWPQSVTGFVPLHSKIYPTETKDWGEAIIDFVAEHHNPLVLGSWLNGKGAKKMELASDQEVIDTAMRIIRQYVGKSFDIPDPAFMLRTQWGTNQDIAGSYSYGSVASEKLFKPRENLASPLINRFGKPVVLFAGEATHSHHYSTVHGALESGWREAERILQYVSAK